MKTYKRRKECNLLVEALNEQIQNVVDQKQFSPLNIYLTKFRHQICQQFRKMQNKTLESIQGKISSEFPFLTDKKKQSDIKCFSKEQNIAKYACCEKQCEKNPFMCEKNAACQCFHPKCKREQLSYLISKISQKAKAISQTALQSTVFINNFQQDLNTNYFNFTKNNIQNSIITLSKTNLFSTQSSLLQKLADKNKHKRIHSLAFYNILKNEDAQKANKNKLALSQFQKEAQQKWNNLKNIIKNQLNSIQTSWNSYTLFYGTKVATEQQQILKIQALFQDQDIVKTKLLYRASENQFQVDPFHEQCNGIQNNILLVKTKEKAIIGAYTPLAWQYPKLEPVQFTPDTNKSTFLFSLTNKQKLIQKNENVGIRNSKWSGPTFGTKETYDFGIQKKANLDKSSYIYFRGNFIDKDNIYNSDNAQKWNSFTNSNNNAREFLIQEWEVWQLDLAKKQK